MKPRSIDLVGPDELRVSWSDGLEARLRAAQLRLACPCAACVEEGTGRKVFGEAQLRPGLTILSAEPVGRYAVAFRFSDGHHTGIYTFEHLRRLAAG
jgi:DUF971 family protein